MLPPSNQVIPQVLHRSNALPVSSGLPAVFSYISVCSGFPAALFFQ